MKNNMEWWAAKPLIPEPVKVAKIRMKLAEYFSSVCEKKGRIYSTGRTGDVLLMSPETLKGLELRQAVNIWAKRGYTQMDLDSMMVLSNGIRTKDLPKDTLTGLSAFFRLIHDILDMAADAWCDARLANWGVTTHIQNALGKEPSTVKGVPFWNEINEIVNSLFKEGTFQTEDLSEGYINLGNFLGRISSISFDERYELPDAEYLKNSSLTREQRIFVSEMLHEFSVWIRQILWIQPFDFDLQGSDLKRIEAQYGSLKELYEKNIGHLPNISFFPI